ISIGDELVQVSYAEGRDDRMDPYRQVGQMCAQVEELLQPLLKLFEIAGNAADEVVLFANAVQRQVDDQLTLRTGSRDPLHPVRYRTEERIGRYVDDAWAAMFGNELRQLRDVRIQQRLAAADGEPIGRPPQRSQCLVPFVESELTLALHPDI